MRTISTELQTAQDAASNEPYIKLFITGPWETTGTVSYNYSSNRGRLKQLEHYEGMWDSYATIILDNSDGQVVEDLTGYWVEIGYGYKTTLGYDSSPTSRLWVKSQLELSAEGQRYTVLELVGVWRMLAEQLLRTGDPPFYIRTENPETGNTYYSEGMSAYGLIEAILAEVSTTDYVFELLPLDEDDGIIDTFVPKFEINTLATFEDALTLVRRLMDMTKSYLRAEADLKFRIIYPQEDDVEDVTYYSYQNHYFYESLERRNLVIPNHIIVFANAGDDGLWTDIITAEAMDEDQIEKYRDITEIHLAPTIDDQDDAYNRAVAILTKQQAGLISGRLIAPHDCRLQLYDKVNKGDNR